jgi:hypothetical protein
MSHARGGGGCLGPKFDQAPRPPCFRAPCPSPLLRFGSLCCRTVVVPSMVYRVSVGACIEGGGAVRSWCLCKCCRTSAMQIVFMPCTFEAAVAAATNKLSGCNCKGIQQEYTVLRFAQLPGGPLAFHYANLMSHTAFRQSLACQSLLYQLPVRAWELLLRRSTCHTSSVFTSALQPAMKAVCVHSNKAALPGQQQKCPSSQPVRPLGYNSLEILHSVSHWPVLV